MYILRKQDYAILFNKILSDYWHFNPVKSQFFLFHSEHNMYIITHVSNLLAYKYLLSIYCYWNINIKSPIIRIANTQSQCSKHHFKRLILLYICLLQITLLRKFTLLSSYSGNYALNYSVIMIITSSKGTRSFISHKNDFIT